MSRTSPLVAAEEFRQLPEDGIVRELVSSVIVERASPTPAHELLVSRLQALLSAHVETADLGAVFRYPWPLELSKFDIVRPDLYFVSWRERGIEADRVTATPELVLEVVSPESKSRDVGEKKRLYAWAGVFEYWIVDPVERTFVAKKRGRQGFDDLSFDGNRFESDLLPGLTIDLTALFAEIDG